MKKFTKQIRGSISLFLSMIILLLVILEGFLIDGSKILAGKSRLADAGDLALNAGLTYYDEALRDIYGLFAISETEDELKSNLETHIRRTLGESLGEAEGAYVDQLLGLVDSAIQGEFSGGEMGKLLDMKLEPESLSVIKVPNSVLSNDYVIKQQILEYMKYRGPASIGYGILQKLNMFKDMKKQQKVMEKKLDYEEKLSDIEKLCEKVYKALNPEGEVSYNDILDGKLEPKNSVEPRSIGINKNIRGAIEGTWCYSLLTRDFHLDKNWKKKTDYSGTDVEGCISNCTYLNQLTITAEAAEANLAVNVTNAEMDMLVQGGMEAAQAALGYVYEYEKYRKVYTAWINFEEDNEREREWRWDRIEELEEEEEPDEDAIAELIDEIAELREEYERVQEIYSDTEEAINPLTKILDTAREKVKAGVDLKTSLAGEALRDLRKDAVHLQEMAIDGQKGIVNLVIGLDEAEAAGQAWDSSINTLDDGDVKSSMKADYTAESKVLDREKIKELKERLEKGEAYGKQLIEAVDRVKIFSLMGKDARKDADTLRNQFNASSYGNDTNSAVANGYTNFDREFYKECALDCAAKSDAACVTYLVETPGGGKTVGKNISMNLDSIKNDMNNISAKEDEFYKYLERTCKQKESDEGAKSDAEESKKTLLDNGNKSFKAEGINVRLNTGGGDGSSDFKSTDKEADDKTVSANAKENSKNSANFIEQVGQLLTNGRNKLYISEYAMEMFSYYTIEKTEKEAKSLSGYPFSSANNVMYRAEAEYILWGNSDGSTNINYTLASIFGIRFLLNTIYAFTGDPEIRHVSLAMATAIAGWTGFGVPLVQSVIIIGFALAETTHDMTELVDGRDVPIYKSQNTWVVKPSGITKAAVQEAVNKTAEKGKEYLFQKLDELTEDTKDKFKSTLQDYKKETIDTVVDTAVNTVLSPMEKCLAAEVNKISPSREEVAEKVDNTITAITESISSEDDTVASKLKKKALEEFVSGGYKDNLVNKITDLQQRACSDAGIDNQTLLNEIDSYFKNAKSSLESKLTTAADSLVDPLVQKVESAVDSGNENIQKAASDALDDMVSKINGGIADSKLPDTTIPDGSKGKSGGAAALTMNYKEYVNVFIAIKCIGGNGEKQILQRIGNLIQANLALSETKPSPDFKIGEAATMLELKASSEIRTTFFAMPVPMTDGGSKVLGQDKYSISYHGILGY